jgi:hypothetical protein
MSGRFLTRPALWGGLVLGALPYVLHRLDWIGGDHLKLLAFAGFVAGWIIVGRIARRPKPVHPWEADLAFNASGDARQAIEAALAAMRQVLNRNPENRFDGELQQKLRALLQRMETLLKQWEDSRGVLSLEDDFHARQIAVAYLPDALRGYLSLPKAYATQKLLENGHTARDTFVQTLDDLDAKVGELQDDLAGQDAQAFLSHSRFIDTKFRRIE